MTPAAIIQAAAADGVRLALTEAGTLKTIGHPDSVQHWLPRLREHKAAIMQLLAAADDPVRLPPPCTTSAACAPKTFLIALLGREPFGVSCPQGEEAVRAQWPTATSVRPV